MSSSKKVDLFDTLTRLFTKESLDHLDEQTGNPFIILRFLAFDPAFVDISKELMPYISHMSVKRLCVFLQSVLPKANGIFIKNLAPRLAHDPLESLILNKIKKYFTCNDNDARVYKDLIEKQGIDLKKFFGLNYK